MIINAANLATLRQGLQARFDKGLQSKPRIDVERFATVVPSNTQIENYPMGAFLDTIREWIGPRQMGNFELKNLQLSNDDFEWTIPIPANAIEDDQIGIYGDIAEGKSRQAQGLWVRLSFQSLNDNKVWVDNKAFFVTNRKFNKVTINNKTTDALNATTFDTAVQTMMSYQGFDGEPLGIVPDLLVVGPSNREAAFDILKSQNKVTPTGDSNSVTTGNHNQNYCDFIVNERLVGDYASDWYLMSTNGAVKPILVQKRKEGKMVALDKPTDPNVFFGTIDGENAVPGGVYVYGGHYRGAATLTLPHLIYGGRVSDAA